MLDFLIYVGWLLLLTLGTIVICGLAAWLAERLFVHMTGSTAVVYASSVIGTPIHELGHAAMCLVFGHKIKEMHLLLPPGHPSGTLGYVSHSYNPRNPWAVLGNLFIGVGPIFSGLSVMILTLALCFPEQWDAYLTASGALRLGEGTFAEVLHAVPSLLVSMITSWSADTWWRTLLGFAVILAVSQHLTLSGADIKGALSALPLYLLLVLLFSASTFWFGWRNAILDGLWHFNLCLFSLFAVVMAFSAVWILLALLIRLWHVLRRAF